MSSLETQPPKDALTTASGLRYVITQPNPSGLAIAPTDWVRLHYTGQTMDGNVFDSSRESAPVVFPLEQLIPGMQEAIALGRIGESLRVWIPEELAYKDIPGAPQGTLVFAFDILDIVTPVCPPLHPTQDAIHAGDGLMYRYTQRGNGEETITSESLVALNFTGWLQKHGTRFHSSLEVGEPLVGEVSKFFPGFSRALIGARAGDSLTIWVPEALGIAPGDPDLEGTLIFEVDVLGVKP